MPPRRPRQASAQEPASPEEAETEIVDLRPEPKRTQVELISEEVSELLKHLPKYVDANASGRKQVLKTCVHLLNTNRKEAGQPFDAVERKALPYVSVTLWCALMMFIVDRRWSLNSSQNTCPRDPRSPDL
jgi:hypothetical protein